MNIFMELNFNYDLWQIKFTYLRSWISMLLIHESGNGIRPYLVSDVYSSIIKGLVAILHNTVRYTGHLGYSGPSYLVPHTLPKALVGT